MLLDFLLEGQKPFLACCLKKLELTFAGIFFTQKAASNLLVAFHYGNMFAFTKLWVLRKHAQARFNVKYGFLSKPLTKEYLPKSIGGERKENIL